MRPKIITPVAIYLLHFDVPDSGVRHYLGSTEWHRLPERMKRHQSGTGGAFTRRMALLAAPFTLARVWCPATRNLEKELKRRSHYRLACPVCTPGMSKFRFEGFGLEKCQFNPSIAGGRGFGLNWQDQAGEPDTEKLKTETRRTENPCLQSSGE